MPGSDEFVIAQRALTGEWGFRSYREALRSWIATVAIVEVEYVGEGEEFAAELSARDYLAEVLRRAPSMHEKIESDLDPWDARFRAATVEHAESDHADGDGWWQHRRPRNWRQPATEELRALGIIQ